MRLLRFVLPLALTLALHAQAPAPTPEQIESRVDSLLSKLTPGQKLELIGGHDRFYTAAVPSIGLPALRMADGPIGVRNGGGPSTAYPAGIALAATFDSDLAFAEGTALARDSRSRGVHIILGPGVNIYRAPMNGRNFEYFGEDPFLAARMAVSYIEGVQGQGVSATVKHFALNNEEYDRHHINSIVDERTLHEIYLPAFEYAVTEAHVGAIMDSYNLVNGQHSSQNSPLNNEIAKGLWHFPGVIMSDWTSVYDGPAAALGGLDIEMPSAKFMTPANLSGKVPQSVIDDKVRRILRLAVTMGWLDRPQTLDAPKDDPASRAVAHRAALESITLLKNDAATLPLDVTKVCTIAVLGPNANDAVVAGGGSSLVVPPGSLSIVEALKAALPAKAAGPNSCGITYNSGLSPDGKTVSPEAKTLAAHADAVIIVVGFNKETEREGSDRTFNLPGGQDDLITQIAALNKHTIVTINAGGGVAMPWIATVPAVLHLWYGGEESAPALAEILFGKSSPEGHLPISIERTFSDNPTHDTYYAADPAHPEITLSEGVFLGYRYYTSNPEKPQPLFPFGFGLSYSSFAFSHLHADKTAAGVSVSFDVKNTGPVRGGEAVQVYVSDPSAGVKRPAEELKAFRKIHLEPKESQHLQFTLDRRAFAYWSTERHDWRVDPGKFTISVGDSSISLPLTTELTLDAVTTTEPAVSPAKRSTAAGAESEATTPFYNGTKEYSLEIDASKIDHSNGKEAWTAPKSYKTRVIEQLAGFTAKPVPTDKWGGRTDITANATGYFYTKKIGDRWWAIDPLGNAYFHQAVVDLAPNTGPNGKAALAQSFNNEKAVWMAKTHAFLLQEGIQGAGAWSDASLIRNSPLQAAHPIAYTVNLDVMSSYGKHRGGMHADVGHVGYLNDTIFAFDPEWPAYADKYIKDQVEQYKDDPALFGYFSDNEMPVRRQNLEHYLDLPHSEPGYIFAKQFMDDHHTGHITEQLEQEFLGIEIDHYASAISAALKKYDPHHMYLGCRYTGQTEQAPEAFAALGKYADAISVNYYNSWTPDFTLMATWEKAAQKPIIITEWYTKGADSGMPNKTGAGWLVATQAQRGAFYQNYAMALIESKIVIGWHWFKYQDNDPNDPHAEASNKDANKGIVNIRFQPYTPLTDRIRQLNPNAYALADYFDTRKKP